MVFNYIYDYYIDSILQVTNARVHAATNITLQISYKGGALLLVMCCSILTCEQTINYNLEVE